MSNADLYSTYPPYATWAVHLGYDGWIYAQCVAAQDFDPKNEHDRARLEKISGEKKGKEWMGIVRHGIAAKGGSIHYTLDHSDDPPPPIVQSMIDFMSDALATEGLETHLHYEPWVDPPDLPDDPDLTVLMRKARDGELEWVQDLIDRYADMEAIDDLGCTALMHATFSGQLKVIDRLLRAGADPNALTRRERTALMIAVEDLRTSNRADVIRTLLTLGADPNLFDASGYTALDRCWREDPRIAHILREFGGKRARELIPLYERRWFKWPLLIVFCAAIAWGFWELLEWAYPPV